MKNSCTRLRIVTFLILFLSGLSGLHSQMINKWDEMVRYQAEKSVFHETGKGLDAADSNHYAAIVNYNTTTNDSIFVVRTTDGGKSWNKILGKSDNEAYMNDTWLYLSNPSPKLFIVTGYTTIGSQNYSFEQSLIMTSRDSGKTWSRWMFEINSRLISPNMFNPYIGGVVSNGMSSFRGNFIIKTKDGWNGYEVDSLPSGTEDCTQIQFLDTSSYVVIVTDDTTGEIRRPERHLYRTTDFGESWTRLPPVIYSYNFRFEFISKLTGYAINYQNEKMTTAPKYVVKTTDGGMSWVPVLNIDEWFNDIDCADSLNIIISYREMIMRSTDGGASWSREYPRSKYDMFGNDQMRYVKYVNPGIALAASDGVSIFRLGAEKVLAPPEIVLEYKKYHDPDSVNVHWAPVAGADYYKLQMFENDTTVKPEYVIENPSKYMVFDKDKSDTLHHIDSLEYYKSYIVRAKSKNSSQESDWSNYLFFSTKHGKYSLSAPELIRPMPYAVEDAVSDTFLVKWNKVDYATGYELKGNYKSRDTANADMYDFTINDIKDTAIVLTGLKPMHKYWINARARAEESLSEWSEEGIFQTWYGMGIEENMPGREKIFISPNPANDKISIEVKNTCNGGVIKVYNELGREMTGLRTYFDVETSNIIDLDTANLPEGSYFVKFQQGRRVRAVSF